MAATPQTRGTPTGTMVPEGLGCLVAIEGLLTLECNEKVITPPGWTLGDPVNLSSHHHTNRPYRKARTRYDRKPLVFTANMDPTVMNTLFGVKGTNKWITITYPDGVDETDYGWVNRCEPSAFDEGGTDPPTVEIEIQWVGLDSDGSTDLDPDWRESGGSDI